MGKVNFAALPLTDRRDQVTHRRFRGMKEKIVNAQVGFDSGFRNDEVRFDFCRL